MIYYWFLLLLLILVVLAGALKIAVAQIKAAKIAQTELAGALEELRTRYKSIIDLEAFKQSLSQEILSLQEQIANKQNVSATLSLQCDEMNRQLALYSAEETVIDCGFYAPVYDFKISQIYKDALDEVREQQKTMLKAEAAILCKERWTVNGNVSEGKRLTKNYMRLMLRAFNGESDAIIASVRWNNIQRMIDRLESIYQAINKLAETQHIKIERSYFQLKLKELQLTYEYQEKIKAEKDEQRRIQDQIREEERAQREIQEQIRKSEEEERRSRIALERARQELQLAQGAEAAQMSAKIQVLEAQLAEALANKERVKSRAEMTKAGNVYIISNIGSFGENRFKIGMTRRWDPQERIYELGNASVPFEFDVHAMIPSDNAPQLEAALHARFRNRSVNLVNQRKEFFDVTLDEISAAVREFNSAVEVIKIPEAKTYRQTLALRTQMAPSTSEQAVPKSKEYQVYLYCDGAQQGPFSFEQVNEKIVSGQIDPATTLLWYEGQPSWAPIQQFQQGEN